MNQDSGKTMANPKEDEGQHPKKAPTDQTDIRDTQPPDVKSQKPRDERDEKRSDAPTKH
jgi:hypothetical protein